MDAVDIELITVERLTEIPKAHLRELDPDALTPLQGKIYVYRQMVPDLTDTSTDDVNQKRRIPHLNPKGEPWVKRFVERTRNEPG